MECREKSHIKNESQNKSSGFLFWNPFARAKYLHREGCSLIGKTGEKSDFFHRGGCRRATLVYVNAILRSASPASKRCILLAFVSSGREDRLNSKKTPLKTTPFSKAIFPKEEYNRLLNIPHDRVK